MMKASILPPTKPDSRPSADADHHRQHHRRQAHQQRDARAVHDGREDVAALVVGAQQVLARAALVPTPAAGARRDSSSVARSNGLCGATQGANSEQNTQTARDHRGADRHRRVAEAVPDVAVEEACSASHAPFDEYVATPCAGAAGFGAARRSSRHSSGAHLTLMYLNGMKLSASCTSVTFFFIAQASACWCSGMWPTSSWWILKASRDHGLRLAWSVSLLDLARSAHRAWHCCSCRG